MVKEKSIELILLQMKLLGKKELMEAVEKKKQFPDKTMEEILLEAEVITEFDLVRAMGVKYDIPLVNLAAQKIPSKLLRYLSEEEAKKYLVIPVHETEFILYVATKNPFDYLIFEKIGQISGKQVSPLLATQADIEAAISQNYIQQNLLYMMEVIEEEYGVAEGEDTTIMDFVSEQTTNNPIVKAVKLILEYSYQMGASDIHIEPMEGKVIVRIRVDGDLLETAYFNKSAFSHLLSRLKVIAKLDIAEKRIPQDGRMTVPLFDKKVNMRISTLPTLYGEKVVIRLLGTSDSKDIVEVEQLNMESYNYEALQKGISSPNGIILITGPTGSGKTTTVYAVLKKLSDPKVNIITIEDPIEKMFPGLNQVQVNEKAGLTFAAGLRSVLRQDPDVVMIGEIRDKETAEIGARAAITGHLVIATMHTNDAASSFMRLADMGVEPYIIASSVVCVVAQRLVKRICKYCKEEYEPTEEELLGGDFELPKHLYRGRGCPMCNNTGYRGRIGVYEIINMDTELKKMVIEKADSMEINAYLEESAGMKNLEGNVEILVKRGITTLQEMRKLQDTRG